MKVLLVALLAFSSVSFAQEQLAVRVNENGLKKVMELALKYNTGVANSKTVIVPKELYKFTIKQKDLASNPIVPILNDISNLNLTRDLDFYLNTSDIKVTGAVDPKSLVAQISNSKPDGFDLKLSVNLNTVSVNASSISLCEDKVKGYKRCGSGLKTTVNGLKINTSNRPVVLTTNLRVSIKKGLASVRVLNVASNLESSKYAPTLNINFSSLEVPKIVIEINGQSTELDTSNLREQILDRKAYLGKKLLNFAGDFIANDLAEMINVYLNNTALPTSVEVYHRDEPRVFNEVDLEPKYPRVEVDNTYVKPPVRFEYIQRNQISVVPAKSMMSKLMDEFTSVVRHAQIDLSLKSLKTPGNKDIELAGLLNFVLNHTTYRVKNTLGNSSRTLPALDLSPYRGHDINLAISEPVINGALDLINSTGFLEDLLQETAGMDALSLNSLKLHFTTSNSLRAVANVAVDMKKLRTSFWKNPREWAETGIGTWLERNNNNSVIYFPLEIEVIPVITKNATTGGVDLNIKIKSPFNASGSLLNTYKYPSNVGNMYGIVRDGVLKKLHTSLDDYSNKSFNVNLDKFLNQAGVEFVPKSIVFAKAAYMLVNLQIKDIKFNSSNPTKK